MTTTVERSAGSRSMYQVNASLARMYAMPVVVLPTLGPHLPRRQGHWSPAVRPAALPYGPQVRGSAAGWLGTACIRRTATGPRRDNRGPLV